MLLFLENHDSFSHLLADQLTRLGAGVEMLDTYAPWQAINWAAYEGVVIGPGPGHERTSPHLMGYLAGAVATGLPMLGVCLGMQALGVHFGARLIEAIEPVHGKVRRLIPVVGSGMFEGQEEIVRYHSLVLADLPDCLRAEALSPEGECMALSHKRLPIWAVQYHPEAACTPGGAALLARWLRFAQIESLPLPLALPQHTPPQRVATTLAAGRLRPLAPALPPQAAGPAKHSEPETALTGTPY